MLFFIGYFFLLNRPRRNIFHKIPHETKSDFTSQFLISSFKDCITFNRIIHSYKNLLQRRTNLNNLSDNFFSHHSITIPTLIRLYQITFSFLLLKSHFPKINYYFSQNASPIYTYLQKTIHFIFLAKTAI